MLISDRQSSVTLNLFQNGYSFSHLGEIHKLSSLDEVHDFFRKNTELDSIKFTCDGQKHYAHFWDKEVEVYSTKKAFRRTLSQEGGGTWIEEKGDKKRYFVEEKGWLSSSFKEVEAKDCVETPSVWQKVLGLGLGILALAPGVSEFARRIPISKEAAGLGLLAMQPKNSLRELLALSLMPSEIFAQNVTNSTEFQVNNYTLGNQINPRASVLVGGRFVIVWESDGQDGDGRGIYGKLFGGNGFPIRTEFQINNFTANNQENPCVSSLSDGGFVVVWENKNQVGGLNGIFGQRYDGDGVRRGLEFQITSSSALYPSVAGTSDGGFVVTWYGQDGDGNGVYGRRYDANGAIVGGEFLVNTYTTSDQRYPSVSAFEAGGVIITWASLDQDGDSFGIYAQKYDVNGSVVDSELHVSTYIVNDQLFPNVATLRDGGFVVAWASHGQAGTTGSIFAQRYDQSGTSVGSEFQVNTYTPYQQEFPSIAPLVNGGFVITWQSSGRGIFGRRYDQNGIAIGDEFQIHTYTTNDQLNPSAAGLSDGGFIVTWESIEQDGDLEGIFAQRYNSIGTPIPLISTEFQINTYTVDQRERQRVVGLPDGGFMAVWSSYTQDTSQWGVFGQVYDRNGYRSGGEFQINTYIQNHQHYPSISVLANGQVIVVWQSNDQDGSEYGIFGQLFAPNSSSIGGEFQVNNYSTSIQVYPNVAALNNGEFVVVWDGSYDRDGAGSGIYAQRFANNASTIESEFQVNNFTVSNQRYADIVGISDGGFVAVWQSNMQDGDLYGIYGQRYDSNGILVSPEFQINTYTNNDQELPRIARLQNGGFVVTWQSLGQDSDLYGVYGQRFDNNAAKIGPEFQVNTFTTSNQQTPSVTGLLNGDFVITWESRDQDGELYGIYGQRYDSNGTALGSEFQVNVHTTNDQRRPSVSSLSNGGFVVVWRSTGQDGNAYGIYGQRYDPNGNPIGLVVPLPTMTSTSLSPSQSSSETTSAFSTSSAGSPTQGTSSSLSSPSFRTTNIPTSTMQMNSSSPSTSFQTPAPTISTAVLPLSSNPSVLSFSSLFLPLSTQTEEITGPTSAGFSSQSITDLTSSGNFVTDSTDEGNQLPLIAGITAVIGLTCIGALSGILIFRKKRPPTPPPTPPPTSSSSESSESSSSEDQVDLGPYPLDELVKNIDGKIFVGPNQEYEILSSIDREIGKEIRKKTGFRVNFHGGKVGSGEIGAGQYGSVSIARTKSGEYVALKKVLNGPNNNEVKEAIDEAKIHYHLRNVPNIIPFYDGFLSNDDQVIYLASYLAGYGTGKDLSTNLQNIDDPDQKDRIIIDAAKGLSRAVAGMHAKRIYHLDLKWDNVVLDKNGEAYVIDLGKAQVLSNGKVKEFKNVLPEFVPPEMYNRFRGDPLKDPDASKIDAWGLGTCLLNFVLGKNFFNKKGISNRGGEYLFHRGSDEEFAKDLHAEMNQIKMPEGLRGVIVGLLKFDPRDRLTSKEAMKVLNRLESYEDNEEGIKLREQDYKKMKALIV